jgi:lipid-A-disaccharide synthase
MRACRDRCGDRVRFRGIGGPRMAEAGLQSLFAMHEITAMGFAAVIAGLPRILRRMSETVRALAERPPDLLLTIDSPDFNLRVARRLRRRAPGVPIVHWVCPSVWAWRPGRAPAMRPHVDLVLCLLPFEPEALHKLAGPPGVHVGHPLLEHLPSLQPSEDELRRRQNPEQFSVAVLPGSRRGELHHHLPAFGEAVGLLSARWPGAEFVLPTLAHLQPQIDAAIADWPVRPHVVVGETARYAAFRSARGALAASGTVTLELGMSGVPTLSGYRLAYLEAAIARRMIRVETGSLVNLVVGRRVVPEAIQEQLTGPNAARQMQTILSDGPARQAQLDGLSELPARLAEGLGGLTPSKAATQVVLRFLESRPRQNGR